MSSFSQLFTRRRDASASLVLLIVSSGFALASLDLFVVNVALPKIAQDFGSAGLGDLSWVLNAYAIVYASLLVVFGRLADRFPREYGFLLGIAVFALFAGLKPDYFADIFPGLVIAGVGVGLTLPTMMASATSELPRENFATGSAVVNMLRQVGLAIGVAVLIAVLGTPSGAHAVLDAFDRSWLVTGAFAAASALASLAIIGVRRPPPYAAPTGATVPI